MKSNETQKQFVGNGVASNFVGSGASYTLDVTPSGQGAVTIDVAGTVAQDAAGNKRCLDFGANLIKTRTTVQFMTGRVLGHLFKVYQFR